MAFEIKGSVPDLAYTIASGMQTYPEIKHVIILGLTAWACRENQVEQVIESIREAAAVYPNKQQP
jgi:hypothetical protein